MKYKVYGMASSVPPSNGEQVRVIVAASSQARAAFALAVPLGTLRTYASVTGNKREIEVATAEPGVVFWQPMNTSCSSRWYRWDRGQ